MAFEAWSTQLQVSFRSYAYYFMPVMSLQSLVSSAFFGILGLRSRQLNGLFPPLYPFSPWDGGGPYLTDLMEKHQKLSLVSQVTDFKDEIKLIILLRFCFFSLYLWIEKIHRQGR